MLRSLQHSLPFMPDPQPVAAHLRLEGVIGGRGSGRGLTLAGVAGALDKAFAAPGRVCVALSINSPGGSPVQSRLIHDRIRALSDEKNVPVYVFCEDLAASGGYMLALAGDEIFADASSIVGSIGVIGAGFGAHEAIGRLGIERRVYTVGRNKSRLDPFLPEQADDVAFVQKLQGGIHEEFKTLVTSRRGRRLDQAAELFEGDVWLGREAQKLGLIDGIGHMRDVLRERYGPALQFKNFTAAKPPFLQRMFRGATDQALEAVEERLVWSRFGS